MTFKEKLVRLRKLKGLTQDEFASAVGVSRQAVYKWESGQSYPEVAKLLEIKVLFNISIDDLLDDNYEVALPEKKKRKRAVKETKPEAAEAVVIDDSETPAEVTVTPVEPVEEPVAVVSVAQDKSEAVEETVQPVSEEPSVTEPAAEEESLEEENKKKVGFFGRIFGRK